MFGRRDVVACRQSAGWNDLRWRLRQPRHVQTETQPGPHRIGITAVVYAPVLRRAIKLSLIHDLLFLPISTIESGVS